MDHNCESILRLRLVTLQINRITYVLALFNRFGSIVDKVECRLLHETYNLRDEFLFCIGI
jgi:hypothetical protein